MQFRHLVVLLAILTPAISLAKDEAPAKPAKAPVVEKTEKAEAAASDDAPIYGFVILQGLNKVTGKISRLEGPVNKPMRFGSLEISAKRCWKAPPEDQPENAALLEIREQHNSEESKRIFLGWMFSSSPGLSGLEHPVYDINIVSCELHATPPAKVEEKPALQEAPKAEVPAKKAETPVKKPAVKAKKAN